MSECEGLAKCKEEVSERLTNIEATQKLILEKLESFEEVQELYTSGKGFVKTWRAIGKVLIWLTLTSGAIMVIIKALSSWVVDLSK